MNVRIGKRVSQLTKNDRDRLADEMTKACAETLQKEEADLQVRWIKLAAIALHDNFGFGPVRLRRWLYGLRKCYKKNVRVRNDGRPQEQFDEWVDGEMRKIFGSDESFDDFLGKMRGEKIKVVLPIEREVNVE